MKQIILFGVTMLCIACSVSAQNDFAFGVKAGANYSNVYDSDDASFEADSKFGFAAGAFLSIPFTEFVGIQPELLFSQRGFHATGTMFGSSYTMTRTTNFIDAPLLLAIKPAESFTILVGPQFSYLVKQKDEFSNPSGNFQQEEEFKNDNIRKNILCFTGGFDANFQHTVLGFRTGWDLSNNHGDGTSSTPRYKNFWLQATLGFRFY
jgi:hypothetical protein